MYITFIDFQGKMLRAASNGLRNTVAARSVSLSAANHR